MITILSPFLSYSTEKDEALHKAQELSIEKDRPYSVIYGFSEYEGKNVYYIEQGTTMIRTHETLIAEFERGVRK